MITGMVGIRVSAAVAGLLAQTPAPPPGDPAAGRGEEFGKTSPLALVVILLLALATILLIRSMNKRLRNVPASFDADREAGSDGAEGADGSGSGDRATDDQHPDDHGTPAAPDDRGRSSGSSSSYGRPDG